MTTGRIRLWLCAGITSATLFAAPGALADATTDKAMAETLFRDGLKLFDEGKVPEACRKLEASLKLDRVGGTLLALGICHEEEGLTATAWQELLAALSMAKAKGRADREKTAREHLDALEPKLSKLTIVVPPAARAAGLEVRLDGTLVPEAGWGSATPVDPGMHAIVVSAPGRKEWKASVTIGKVADKQTLEVIPLDPAPPSTGSPSKDLGAPVVTSNDTSGRRNLGWVGVGVGGAFAAAAVGSFLLANKSTDDLKAYRNGNCRLTCDDGDRVASVRRWEAMTWISGGLSLAALGVGVTLVVTSSSSSTTVAVRPAVNGFSVVGAF